MHQARRTRGPAQVLLLPDGMAGRLMARARERLEMVEQPKLCVRCGQWPAPYLLDGKKRGPRQCEACQKGAGDVRVTAAS